MSKNAVIVTIVLATVLLPGLAFAQDTHGDWGDSWFPSEEPQVKTPKGNIVKARPLFRLPVAPTPTPKQQGPDPSNSGSAFPLPPQSCPVCQACSTPIPVEAPRPLPAGTTEVGYLRYRIELGPNDPSRIIRSIEYVRPGTHCWSLGKEKGYRLVQCDYDGVLAKKQAALPDNIVWIEGDTYQFRSKSLADLVGLFSTFDEVRPGRVCRPIDDEDGKLTVECGPRSVPPERKAEEKKSAEEETDALAKK